MQPGPATVSIVMPCFNGARWLSEAIGSALAQTHREVEVILVDDGSTDDSLAIAQSYKDRIRIETQPRRGAAAARNVGLRRATGTFVKFLDADDALLPDCVEWQVRGAADLPTRKAALFGHAIYVGENDASLPYRVATPEEGLVALPWIIANLINTAGPLYRRDDVEAVGGFNEALTAGQEYDLNVRLAIDGLSFFYRNLPAYRFRQHDTPSRMSLQMAAAVFPVRIASTQRHIRLAAERFGTPVPLPLRRAFAHHLWGLGRGALRGNVPELAARCFGLARETCPEDPVPGSAQYRLAARLLSPEGIEKLSRAYHALADRK